MPNHVILGMNCLLTLLCSTFRGRHDLYVSPLLLPKLRMWKNPPREPVFCCVFPGTYDVGTEDVWCHCGINETNSYIITNLAAGRWKCVFIIEKNGDIKNRGGGKKLISCSDSGQVHNLNKCVIQGVTLFDQNAWRLMRCLENWRGLSSTSYSVSSQLMSPIDL